MVEGYEGRREANWPYARSVCSITAVARLVRNKKWVLSMISPENSNLQTQLVFRKCPTHMTAFSSLVRVSLIITTTPWTQIWITLRILRKQFPGRTHWRGLQIKDTIGSQKLNRMLCYIIIKFLQISSWIRKWDLKFQKKKMNPATLTIDLIILNNHFDLKMKLGIHEILSLNIQHK